MKIIGLAGQTGAGKSTVAHSLEKSGYYHIDADLVAKQVISSNKDVISALCECFGKDILLPDGGLDRKLLAKRAFSSHESAEKLSSITFPAAVQRIKEIIEEKRKENCVGVIVDAIGLFESELYKLCDKNICVVAPLDIRLKRIIERDNISEESARERILAQKDEDYFSSRADVIIKNYPPYDLESQIKGIFQND